MKIADISVELIDHMGSDLSVVNAARVSFDKTSEPVVNFVIQNGVEHKVERLNDADTKLIRYLATHNHWSPFSHAFVSFRIKAPLFVARQLGKHVVGLSWNEVSRRYVDSEPEFYLPDYWRKRSASVKQGSADEAVEDAEECVTFTYTTGEEQHVNEFALEAYNELLRMDVCAEQARMILPQNTMTEWIWSGSLYAFARVCNLRLDSHTQRETQKVAQQISNHMKDLFPVSWETLVKEAV